MKKVTELNLLVISIISASIFFIPVFFSNNLGSDWDSYALIGTYLNYKGFGVYIPSRPPGFPIYELLIGLIIEISNRFHLISFEQGLLIFQYLTLIGLNTLIYKFFQKNNKINILCYLIIVFSPIYLISGLSVIDYFLGSLLGFGSLYIVLYENDFKYNSILTIFLLSTAIGIRLSNIIFLIAIVLFLCVKHSDYRRAILLVISTIAVSSLLYFPFYRNLFSFYVNNGVYNSINEMVCVINLTNTDHDFLGRVGRFFLKQINYLGTAGFLIFLYLIKDLKVRFNDITFLLFTLFILFQLSFLRLPTEEGHLLPAFIAFLLLISNQNQLKIKIVFVTVVLTFLSNFIDVKFYQVNQVDSASSASLQLSFEEGLFIEDYKLRIERSKDKEFNYSNSEASLFQAWNNGCPN